MMYKVPMPTRTNGVKILKLPGEQIGIEYQTGEPHVGKMAYDSSCGILSKNITFRRPDIDRIIADAVRQVYGRDDLPPGTGISRSEGKMKPRGSTTINDQDQDEDDGDEIVTKLMSYLNDKLTPEQLSSVAAILGSADDDAPDSDAGEPRNYQASDRGLRGRQERQAAMDADFAKLFPDALKILRR